MELARSISYPKLLVSLSGKVFYFTSRKEIMPIRNHQLTTRGYVIQFHVDETSKKVKTVSLLNLVYEAHVKGSRIASTDVVRTYDGNDFNPVATNLYAVDKRKGRTKKPEPTDSYSSWMNGDDELFL